MSFFKIVLFFFFTFCFFISDAQFLPADRFTIEDALPHSNVFRIFQDKKGFMWFGTEYGLSRFDGKTFKNFIPGEGMLFNSIMSISETKDEKKWICTYGGGINSIINDSIFPIQTEGQMPRHVIFSLIHEGKMWFIDKHGDLFLMTGNKIKKHALKDENFIFQHKNSVTRNS